MKKLKKIFAAVLVLAMVLGLNVTTFAEGTDSANTKKDLNGAQPSADDKVYIKIDGISAEEGDQTETVSVTLYKIARAKYGQDGRTGFIEYEWASIPENLVTSDTFVGRKIFQDVTKPTANEIASIANCLKAGTVSSITAEGEKYPIADSNVSATYTKEVSAGVYIAIITGSTNGYVYNPVLLAATYDATKAEGSDTFQVALKNDPINVSDVDYMYGSTAVAKRSEPGLEKKITNGTTMETLAATTDTKGIDTVSGNQIHTASVGDVITYEITPTMPEYPEKASNKTFVISDTMTQGLTLDYSSLNIVLKDADGNEGPTVTKPSTSGYINLFQKTEGGWTKVFAQARKTHLNSKDITGFDIKFNYEELIYGNGSVYKPVITYKAIVNENAIAGLPGNPNEARLYYANEPNHGETWGEKDFPSTTPENAPGVGYKEDKKTVYTYQLSFKKTGENGEALADAVFGIYKNENATGLIDQVKTDKNGYAVSTNVSHGTYYIKEITAPTGYSLSDKIYPIDAVWKDSTTKIYGEVTDRTYTTTKPYDNAEQIGWIKAGVFYGLNKEYPNDAEAAYLASDNVTTLPENTTVTVNPAAGSGTVSLKASIPNTKLTALPSTGGVGTTIFTLGGCAIMILAAGLYFAMRRKSTK